MNSKPLNRETFLADIEAATALVVCAEIEIAVDFLKLALSSAAHHKIITFTTDGTEALKLASENHNAGFGQERLVFTLGATEAVITF